MTPADSRSDSTESPSASLKNVTDLLVERGRSRGHLRADEITEAFDEAGISASSGKRVLRALSDEGVTVMVDGSSPLGSTHRAAAASAPKRATVTKSTARRAAKPEPVEAALKPAPKPPATAVAAAPAKTAVRKAAGKATARKAVPAEAAPAEAAPPEAPAVVPDDRGRGGGLHLG